MANNFIQETISREILVAQRNSSVIRQFCATEYEGDIQGLGTSVKLNIMVPAQLKDTTVLGNGLDRQADSLATSTVMVQLEQDKNYKFEILHKDVAEGMPKGLFAETLKDIGAQIGRDADKLVLSKYTEILPANVIEDIALDKSNVYDWLIDIDTLMTEKEMPLEGRLIVLPAKIAGHLAKDPIIRQSKEQDSKLGYVGKVGNLTVVTSNDVAIRTDEVDPLKKWYEVMAFVNGKTFAHVNGFNENKVVDSSVITDGFKDIAMGQIVSGAKCIMDKYAMLLEVRV